MQNACSTKPCARARAPRAEELSGLVAWLDEGLRDGRRGRLAAEYPESLGAGRPQDHRVVFEGASPVAHAMLHEIAVRSGARRLPVGLIGLVYTAPHARRRGLAAACIEACVAELGRRGAALALLWSDLHDYYRRLGFERSGVEEQLSLDVALCRRARRDGADAFTPGPPAPDDWPALEALHAAKPVAGERAPGALARLAAAPDTTLVVARSGGRARAYAAAGRGDDFSGVIHEWAGESEAVLACWQSLCERLGPLDVLSGPLREPPVERVREAGAPLRRGCFALARPLDPAALASPPPLPLYLWGFDSI